MDNQYPLCNGEYRDVIDGILSSFTIDSFIGAVTLTSTENSIAINSSFGAFVDPTPSTQGKNRVGAIFRYINDTLPEFERTRVITMLYRDRDFYGFMEQYLSEYDRVCKMMRYDPDNTHQVHRVMAVLKENVGRNINLHYFHPDIFGEMQWYMKELDVSLPVIESIQLLQKKQGIDNNRHVAIEMTRQYYLAKLSDIERHVLCGVASVVDPDVWGNVGFDVAILDMIINIPCTNFGMSVSISSDNLNLDVNRSSGGGRVYVYNR